MSDRPNVVLVVMDTTRMRDVTPETAPTLHDLAESGAGYRRAFANAPWTLPSHASLFTGQYPFEHGATGGTKWLDKGVRTLAEAFRDAGYETGAISNNTWLSGEFGFDRGFEAFQIGWELDGVAGPHDEWVPTDDGYSEGGDGRAEDDIADADEGALASIEWTDGWLAEADDPFFLFANFIEPHIEYAPPREYAKGFLPAGWSYEEARALRQEPRAYDVGEYDLDEGEFAALRGLYRGEIAYLDERLAELRRLVAERAGDDAVFVAVGDHGENVGDHGFLGHQYCVSDTLLRVPLVLDGGPFSDGPTWSDDPVELLDLAPTLLDVAGVADDPARRQFSGRSIHPAADAPAREYAVAEYRSPQPSIERLRERFGDVPDRVRDYDRSIRSIRSDRFRFVSRSDGIEALFDRSGRIGAEADPHGVAPIDRRDVSDEHPDVVAELRSELDDRLGDVPDHAGGDRAGGGDREMAEETAERLKDLGYL